MTPAKVKPPGFGFGLISFSVLKSYHCGGVVNLDMELPIVATNCLLLGALFYLLSSTTMPHEFHQRFMQRKSAEGENRKQNFNCCMEIMLLEAIRKRVVKFVASAVSEGSLN